MLFRVGAAIVIIICVLLLVLTLGVNAAKAVDFDHRGLAIAPATHDVTVAAGKIVTQKITVTNHTDKELVVALQVKEFETTDYTYDFVFKDLTRTWVRLEQNRIVLQPQQKKEVNVTVDVPVSAAPRSHYFAVFASADMSTTGFKQTAQVVSLLMVKVDGEWIQSGVISHGHVPFLNIDSKITYKFDAENTGNVHYNVIVFGQIESLFGVKGKEQGTGHVLIPRAKRAIEGSAASPLWPGIYKFTYGYSKGSESNEVTKTIFILFMPPWAWAVLAIVIFTAIKLRGRFQRRASKKK